MIGLSLVQTHSESARKRGSNIRQQRQSSPIATPLSVSTPGLQRKPACACGGSCPRCREDVSIQPKRRSGGPGDKYEQEADRVAEQVMRMPETETAHPGDRPDKGMGTPSTKGCRQDVKIRFYDQKGTGCNVKARMQFLAFRCVANCNKGKLLNDISSAGAKACQQFCEKKNCYRLSFLRPWKCGLYTCNHKTPHCYKPECPTYNECFYEPAKYYNCQCTAPGKLPIS